MTRKKQVKEYLLTIGNGEMTGIPFDAGFECGAEWADSHPNWISVEDELPPCKGDVLLWSSGFDVALKGFRENDGLFYVYDDDNYWHNITHWMPLPTPPKHFADVSKKISSSVKPNNCKKLGMKGYENVIIHEGNTKGNEK